MIEELNKGINKGIKYVAESRISLVATESTRMESTLDRLVEAVSALQAEHGINKVSDLIGELYYNVGKIRGILQ